MEKEEKIDHLIRKKIETQGYQLKKIEIKSKGKAKELVITIDKGGKLSVEDCAQVSRLIEPILDKENLFEGKYYLIVSSPGIKN